MSQVINDTLSAHASAGDLCMAEGASKNADVLVDGPGNPVDCESASGKDDAAGNESAGAENSHESAEADLDGTLFFKIAYDGAAYSGFAEQPSQTTVAGEIRRALETFLRRPVDITCAGRTDAGVHAQSQYVSVPATEAELAITRRRWVRAMDALLPADIALKGVYHAPAGASARFDALSRTYVYRIADRDIRPLQTRDYVWWHRFALDEVAMAEAAQHLLGEQDFKSFCKVASAVGKPTHRCVLKVGLERTEEFGEGVLAFTITGNAFLHSMVRTIVGTLVEVGMHRREPSWVREAIDACDRRAAGPTAPACGLTFLDVEYPDGLLTPIE